LHIRRHWLIVSCESHSQILDLHDEQSPEPLLHRLLRNQIDLCANNTANINELREYVSWIETYMRACRGGSNIVGAARSQSVWSIRVLRSDNCEKRLACVEKYLSYLESLLNEVLQRSIATRVAHVLLGGAHSNILVDTSGNGAAWILSTKGCFRCPLPLSLNMHRTLKQIFLSKSLVRFSNNIVWRYRAGVGKRYFLTDNGVLYDMYPDQRLHRRHSESHLFEHQAPSSLSIGNGETVTGFFELIEGDGAIVASFNDRKCEHRLWILSSNGKRRRRLQGYKIPLDRASREVARNEMWVLFSATGRSLFICDGQNRIVRFINNYRRSVVLRDNLPDFFVRDLHRAPKENQPGRYNLYSFSGDDFLLCSSQPDNRKSRIVDSNTVREVSIKRESIFALAKYLLF
jgi:hypothetical protein